MEGEVKPLMDTGKSNAARSSSHPDANGISAPKGGSHRRTIASMRPGAAVGAELYPRQMPGSLSYNEESPYGAARAPGAPIRFVLGVADSR